MVIKVGDEVIRLPHRSHQLVIPDKRYKVLKAEGERLTLEGIGSGWQAKNFYKVSQHKQSNIPWL